MLVSLATACISDETTQCDANIKVLHEVEPRKLTSASGRVLTGKVRLQFIVENDGAVSNIEVLESPSSVFVRSAKMALEEW